MFLLFIVKGLALLFLWDEWWFLWDMSHAFRVLYISLNSYVVNAKKNLCTKITAGTGPINKQHVVLSHKPMTYFQCYHCQIKPKALANVV